MNNVYTADIPPAFQVNDVNHLLIEEMEPGDIKEGVFLFFLFSSTQSNVSDEWYESNVVLDSVVLQHFGITSADRREFKWPRF